MDQAHQIVEVMVHQVVVEDRPLHLDLEMSRLDLCHKEIQVELEVPLLQEREVVVAELAQLVLELMVVQVQVAGQEIQL